MLKQQTPYVVVVDDERVIAETLTVILNKHGFSTRFFTNPLEALEDALTKPPKLLISDIMMPQLSGINLAMRMRAQCPSCKILLFSGQTDTADLLVPTRTQGHDFHVLLKLVHPSTLLRKIREQEPSWPVTSSIVVRSATTISVSGHRPHESVPGKRILQRKITGPIRTPETRVFYGKL